LSGNSVARHEVRDFWPYIAGFDRGNVRALRLIGVQREHDRRFAPILSTRCGHHRLLAILLLFIALGLGVFAGGSLLAVIEAATLSGVILRWLGLFIA
jgi:hypothetical protein